MIRALIADDEPLARRRLRGLLGNEPDFIIAAEARDGLEALDAITSGGVDVVFLDVQMPMLDGFEVLESMAAKDLPLVVFITAFQEHAWRAFDASAVDYLVKPFENDRFRRTLQKLRRADSAPIAHEQIAAVRAEMHRYATRLAVRRGRTHELVAVGDIAWIGTERNYIRLHVGSQVLLLRCTLNEIESRLDPREFMRVHRSTIVNVGAIRTIQPHNGTEFLITLKDGTELSTSRTYRRVVARLLR